MPVAGLIALGVQANLPRAAQVAAIGADVNALFRVPGKHDAGVDVAPDIARVALDKLKFRQIDIVAGQDDFLAR